MRPRPRCTCTPVRTTGGRHPRPCARAATYGSSVTKARTGRASNEVRARLRREGLVVVQHDKAAGMSLSRAAQKGRAVRLAPGLFVHPFIAQGLADLLAKYRENRARLDQVNRGESRTEKAAS